MHLRLVPILLGLCTLPILGQFGNGGNGDLETSPMAINSPFTLTVTGAPGQGFLVYASDGPGPTVIPGFFTVSLTLSSPALLEVFSGVIPPSGSATLSVFIPNDPGFLPIVLYVQGAVTDPTHPTGLALTRGIRIDFENPDSFVALPALSAPRALGTGNLLNDGRVLVVGGGNGSLLGPVATNTTELYQPFFRTWSAGPLLSIERAFHASARLNDGRILICGGTSTTGTVTATCEIYDPASNAFLPAASMGTARAGCEATTLADGRVLVTGGTSTFVGTAIGPILNASANSGEVYDPAMNSWTPVGNTMSSKRFVHSQTLLNDGRVLCVGGINGASVIPFTTIEYPTFTASVSLYNPVTNLFSAGASIPSARAAHRATKMANGEVFVSGGVQSVLFVPTAMNDARTYAPASNTWAAAGLLPVSVALHGQVLLKSGLAHVSGGGTGTLTAFSATDVCATRAAGAASLTTTTSMPDARGFHLAVRMHDGSVLLSGGGDSTGAAVGTNLLYTPVP
jgi:hypothetical protein